MIYQDKNSGIIITGNSLAVQRIQRHNEGDYSCLASNDVGTTESQSINLNIKCKKYYFSPGSPLILHLSFNELVSKILIFAVYLHFSREKGIVH